MFRGTNGVPDYLNYESSDGVQVYSYNSCPPRSDNLESDAGIELYQNTNTTRGRRRRNSRGRQRKYKEPPPSTENYEDLDASEGLSYSSVPTELLYCHVCEFKADGPEEFEAHLKALDHSHTMANLILKFNEEVDKLRNMCQLEYPVAGRGHCVMCQVSFCGSLMRHRRTKSHTDLRDFLHPRCDVCSTVYKSRIVWTNHLLMPSHLIKLSNWQDQDSKDGAEEGENINSEVCKEGEEEEEDREGEVEEGNDQIDTKVKSEEGNLEPEEDEDDMETKQNIRSVNAKDSACNGFDRKELRSPEGTEKDCGLLGGNNSFAEEDESCSENIEHVVDEDGFEVPVFREDVEWGEGLLSEITGLVCRGCKRFFECEELARKHCRTKPHFDRFISLMKKRLLYRTSSVSDSSAESGSDVRRNSPLKRNISSGSKTVSQLKRIRRQ